MKKFVAMLLALSLFLLFSACGPEPEPVEMGGEFPLGSAVNYTSVDTKPLHLVSTIPFTQAGEGQASLTNQRKIAGCDSLTLTRKEDGAVLTVDFPYTIAAGEYDWTTGQLTITRLLLNLAVAEMVGAENYPGWDFTDGSLRDLVGENQNGRLTSLGISYQTNIGVKLAANTSNGGTDRLYIGGSGMTRSQWQAQYPSLLVQFCIELADPMVIQLEPQSITALSGTNSLQPSCGTLTVLDGTSQTPSTVTDPTTASQEDPTEQTTTQDAPTEESTPAVESVLQGKTINVLGDSISSTNYERPNWWERIAEQTGAVFNDYGVSGACVATVEGSNGGPDSGFVDRFDEMDATADAVIVMGGTNDNKVPLGTWDSTDTTTFYGALNVLISGLQERYPDKPILFCTMIQTKNGYSEHVDNPMYVLMDLSPTDVLTRQLRAEAIKAKCQQYDVPCLDLYNESGISGEDGSLYYREGDSLHPSQAGQARMAEVIQPFLEEAFTQAP